MNVLFKKLRSLGLLLTDSNERMNFLNYRGFARFISDERLIRKKFKKAFGRELNLENPQTFNEKIQWLKLYDHRPEYPLMVDKYEVKKIVSDKIGSDYVIPLIGVYNNFDEIDFDKLPDKFVLKCTHNSGGLTICRDKSKLDIPAVRESMSRALLQNYYWNEREWAYKDITPRIIAEEYVQDGERINLPVYKILTFNGEPKVIQAIQDDKTDYETIDYFDTDWNKLPFRQNFPNSKTPYSKPEKLDLMLELTAKLSADIPLVRIDWYTVGDKIRFSEFTFYSDAGFAPFDPPEWDYTLGSWVELPKEKHISD